jgi:homocysteine S-methyltransferase
MAEVRDEFSSAPMPVVISGQLGPRGDGYAPERRMSANEAQAYHAWQIGVFAQTEADMIAALTMNYVEEAIGVARAAKAIGIPAAIAFTVETDGRLVTGQSLKDAVIEVDEATGQAPAYFMINCAHPAHFADSLNSGEAWVKRVRGLRANASKRSHAELDNAAELDPGDPLALGQEYRAIVREFPHINVLGGCCGTDHRHVGAISRACAGHGHLAAYAA